MEEIILQDKDIKRLSELYKTAQRTPVISFGDRDAATIAWGDVGKCMDQLGKKYGFNPAVCSINSKTGVVKTYKNEGEENGRS